MAGRGRGAAHVNSLHCAAYLLGFLGAEHAINAPSAVECCSELMPTGARGDPRQLADDARWAFGIDPAESEISADTRALKKSFLLRERSFLEGVALLIEWARVPQCSEVLESSLLEVCCSRFWPEANITFIGPNGDLIEQTYTHPKKMSGSGKLRLRTWQIGGFPRRDKINVNASICGAVLCEFAEVIGPKEGQLVTLDEIMLEPWQRTS
jgi:hypothetical protein